MKICNEHLRIQISRTYQGRPALLNANVLSADKPVDAAPRHHGRYADPEIKEFFRSCNVVTNRSGVLLFCPNRTELVK